MLTHPHALADLASGSTGPNSSFSSCLSLTITFPWLSLLLLTALGPCLSSSSSGLVGNLACKPEADKGILWLALTHTHRNECPPCVWMLTIFQSNCFQPFISRLRICWSLAEKKLYPTKKRRQCLENDTLLLQVVRFQFWRSGECEVLLYCHYSQVHSVIFDRKTWYHITKFNILRIVTKS